MTTPINSFQDILDAMERDPALRDALRRYVLTDEILALPAQVKALTDAVEALVNEFRELRAGQEQLRADVGEIRADVADLRAGQEQLRADVGEIRADVADLRAGQEELRTNVGRMGGDVSRLLGTNYEGKATTFAPRMARRNLGLANPRVVAMGLANNMALPLPEADQAAERGDITWDEADDIVRADVIISATDQDGAQRYVLAEISITVQERYRVRAHRRAALLEKATGVTTIPVVIGIDEEAPAGLSGVEFFQFDPDA